MMAWICIQFTGSRFLWGSTLTLWTPRCLGTSQNQDFSAGNKSQAPYGNCPVKTKPVNYGKSAPSSFNYMVNLQL